jgi:hypothetical protein
MANLFDLLNFFFLLIIFFLNLFFKLIRWLFFFRIFRIYIHSLFLFFSFLEWISLMEQIQNSIVFWIINMKFLIIFFENHSLMKIFQTIFWKIIHMILALLFKSIFKESFSDQNFFLHRSSRNMFDHPFKNSQRVPESEAVMQSNSISMDQ